MTYKTATRSTGEAVVEALIAHGIDTVFGIPGAHMYDFNDALQRASDQIRFICPRHEQAAGYMAYAMPIPPGGRRSTRSCPGPAF